jgi:hypothetical protein
MARMPIASILAMTLASCGYSVPPAPQALRTERMAQLEKIAAACRLPATTLKLVGTEDLHFRPPPDAKYERVDCVLKALNKTDIPTRMGFVGNEVYETGNQN